MFALLPLFVLHLDCKFKGEKSQGGKPFPFEEKERVFPLDPLSERKTAIYAVRPSEGGAGGARVFAEKAGR